MWQNLLEENFYDSPKPTGELRVSSSPFISSEERRHNGLVPDSHLENLKTRAGLALDPEVR